MLAFFYQFLLQNISFISLIPKFALAKIKKKVDMVIKNFYFKLPATQITFSILEKFFLIKIKNNMKIDVCFFYSLIRKTSGIKKVNTINSDKNIFVTTFLLTKNKKDCQFEYNQKKSKKRNVYF